jgi:hypothetical protein
VSGFILELRELQIHKSEPQTPFDLRFAAFRSLVVNVDTHQYPTCHNLNLFANTSSVPQENSPSSDMRW